MKALPHPLTTSKHWDAGIDGPLAGERAARLEREDEIAALEEALALMYDKWENGVSCYEADEEGDCSEGSSLGNAFKLSEKEENSILALLKDVPRG